jgi:mevalonate kinase
MITSSAPGKIILFGEHAVVYGRPALAVPVTQVQATATVTYLSTDSVTDTCTCGTGAGKRIGTDLSADSKTDKRIQAALRGKEIWIDAPDIGLHSEFSRLAPDHPLAAVIQSVLSTLGVNSPPALTIHISSTIPVASGLGSGAAVSVAIIRALSEFLGRPLPDEKISALAYEVEKLHHGTPSGIDNTVIAYAQPVYFVKGRPIKTFHVGTPFTILIGDTGISAPTKESVSALRKLWRADPSRWEKIFDQVGEIVWDARQAIERGDIAELGTLMDANHTFLQEMTVSSVELDHLTEAARKSGALGAKLSGGGRGGNMIALVHKENAPAVAEALMSAGAKRTTITHVE